MEARTEQVWDLGTQLAKELFARAAPSRWYMPWVPLASQSLLFVRLKLNWCGLLARPATGSKEEALDGSGFNQCLIKEVESFTSAVYPSGQSQKDTLLFPDEIERDLLRPFSGRL